MNISKALIVDDSKIARITLKKKLEQRGMETVLAEDAGQALNLLDNEPVDVVFMDHMMPGMDGFEATAQIKANAATAHLPVIMCSGKENPGYLAEARAIGACSVLPKPANDEALNAVFAALEQPAAGAESAGESGGDAKIEPLIEQIAALSERLDWMHETLDQVSASTQDLKAAQAKHSSARVREQMALRTEFIELIDDRLPAQTLPDTETLEARIGASLQTDLVALIEQKLQQGQAQHDDTATGDPLAQLSESLTEKMANAAGVQGKAMAELEQKLGAAIAEQAAQLGAVQSADLASHTDLGRLKHELASQVQAGTAAAKKQCGLIAAAAAAIGFALALLLN